MTRSQRLILAASSVGGFIVTFSVLTLAAVAVATWIAS